MDANIVMACLLRNGATNAILRNEDLAFYAPEFIFSELWKYLPMLLSRSRLRSSELQSTLQILRRRLHVVSFSDIMSFARDVEVFCPDPDDAAYFATALCVDALLWSNDKALKKQDVVCTINNRSACFTEVVKKVPVQVH